MDRKKACGPKKWIPANLIENSVLIHLIQTLGDPQKIQMAIDRATPDINKIVDLRNEQDHLTIDLKKINSGIDNIIDMIADGSLFKDEVDRKMADLRERKCLIKKRLSDINSQLETLPDPVKVKKLKDVAIKMLEISTKRVSEADFGRPYEWKRRLVEHAFCGRDTDGRRLGVYVNETGKSDQPWEFEIRGILESTMLGLPLSPLYLWDAFCLDSDFQNIDEELGKINGLIVSSSACPSPAQGLPESRFPLNSLP